MSSGEDLDVLGAALDLVRPGCGFSVLPVEGRLVRVKSGGVRRFSR